ncbi:MAG TPA: deoxyribodipyrimidine photolyase, partial [Rhodospirillaceae bacterium]|nr:deoxyribodipyrimidine photolyase [Rhodospirillaceae bacterium]
MSAKAPIIVWFRQDLRITDNPALLAAAETGRPILPLYILDEESPGTRPLGGASRWWLHHSLESLAANLCERGLQLLLRRGMAQVELSRVVQESGAAEVVWNRCYEPGAVARDTAAKEMLCAAGVSAESFNGSLLIEPWKIEGGQGAPYKVFSPYWRRLRELYQAPAFAELPQSLPAAKELMPDELVGWSLLPSAPDWAGGIRDSFSVGEAAAQARLAKFLDDTVVDYPNNRNRPDHADTSRLSPYLHWGEIGPHGVWRAAAAYLDKGGAVARGAEAFLRELAWRDFNHHLLFHFPELAVSNWRKHFDGFPWRDDPVGLIAWQQGRTGYPLVDAGMREL